MEVSRTERIWLEPSDVLSYFCHLSKNLYNEANYIVRQEFFNNGSWIRYNELYNKFKTSDNYKELPAKTAQQTLKLVDRNWNSFFQLMKEWRTHPEKFKEKPRPPRYKRKDGEFVLVFTNQQASIKDGLLKLPKKLGLEVKTRLDNINLREVRVIPKGVGYVLEVVYNKVVKPVQRNTNRIAGIDLGVRNLITAASNIGESIVVKGGVARSINQYYNKERSKLYSQYDKQGIKSRDGIKLRRLNDRRDRKLGDYFHKVSRALINWCTKHEIGTIVVGYNPEWKQKANIGKRNNQNFVTIPFYKLVNQIRYKAEEEGIQVIEQGESHTSKCSFFDSESIEHHDEYVGKRKRGLFRTGKGRLINSDVNGALNIIRKAVPDAFNDWADGIEGAVGHPLKLKVLETKPHGERV